MSEGLALLFFRLLECSTPFEAAAGATGSGDTDKGSGRRA